jgi:hypothetical protein
MIGKRLHMNLPRQNIEGYFFFEYFSQSSCAKTSVCFLLVEGEKTGISQVFNLEKQGQKCVKRCIQW